MDKKPLIGVSICAVVLLVLASLTNVVGYQTLESSNQLPIVEQYQVNDQLLQKEITESSNSESECDCENENTTQWNFPVLCTILYPLFWFAYGLWVMSSILFLVLLIGNIGKALDCFWSDIYP